jgi:hypothetical protein
LAFAVFFFAFFTFFLAFFFVDFPALLAGMGIGTHSMSLLSDSRPQLSQ